MTKLTKLEKILLERKKASSLFEQGRSAEGRLKLERIIDELMPTKRKK